MDEQENQLFSIPVDYIYDILDESVIQANLSKNLLADVLEQDLDQNILLLVTEILYTNLTISKLAEREISTSTSRLHPETDEEEYILPSEIIFSLQSLMLARHYANTNLTGLSYSLSLH